MQVDVLVDRAVSVLATLSELTSTTQEHVLVETAVVVETAVAETATEEFVLVLLSTMEDMEETSMFAPLFLLPSPNLK